MPDSTPGPKAVPPLPSSEFYILLALLQGATHGYAIMRAVDEQTAGAVCLGPGTLYGAIKRMLERGLIEEVHHPAGDDASDRGRRTYTLTADGLGVVRAEARRMRDLVGIAGRLGLLPEPTR